MQKRLLLPFFLLFFMKANAQDSGFAFGQISLPDLQMKVYNPDSSASALVLQEFGESRIDNDNDYNLLHDYHVKIKILSSQGFDQANIQVPLYKQNGKTEKVSRIQASTFNLVNGKLEETKFDSRKTFTENKNKYLDLVKFTLPNIQVGSIIEVRYTLESPFIFNFKPWEFQADIPKIHSEYWAKIPGNYHYNMTLRGTQKLYKQDSEIIKDCFTPGGGRKADCALYKFAMQNIPAFVEEEYMTAKSNFLSGVFFELKEVHYFDGRKEKLTKEWKDVDLEMRNDAKFGTQLRKGKEVFRDHLTPLLATETDSLQKARKVFDFIKGWYKWNDTYGKFSELGIKKAFDSKTGNVGDINLSLIAALNMAGFKTEPVILSTRENGLPIDIHPVISDFNYVVARVKINGKSYLLDATDPFVSFGMVPIRCLNGKGRVFPEKGPSSWLEIVPTDKLKQTTYMDLSLQPDGSFKGKVVSSTLGYDALQERKRITSYNNHDEYIEALDEKWSKIKILKYDIKNLETLDQALSQTFEVEIEGFDNLNKNKLFLNPFFLENWEKNPFTAKERTYPVDLGAPIETMLTINLQYPTEFQLGGLPAPITLALPNGGGRFMFQVQSLGDKVVLNSLISLSKPVYSPEEYGYLKELFSKIVQSYQTNLVFNRKS
ncbi:hypothetical protein AAE02nite_03100 [Adhaeribacter aerolatus]|uniref:DUF3857 domain-containing protein n=1 Tax=Adhaeribacter aerolatus TaxID=670289 RepID=A0A512ASG2_9BACT|nr:DUF3857 domain-containing protein [Adhaeribacter aerolatus]GEO02646.1 hypothetical protein AAE02nite_03100 [Adhaeribacter aerolatus]